MMEFGYYPGCALHGSSNDYEQSVQACLKPLGVGLKELDDWLCCGATAAHTLNHMLAVSLPARNLALAERDGFADVFAPCPMCSMELIKVNRALDGNAGLRQRVSEIVELPVEGKTQILNLIQVFQKIGVDQIRAAVKKPLSHVKAACYYGCLLTRPPDTLQFDDPEHPRSMETVLEALGASTVAWNYATECCGAGLTMAREETVCELSHRILTNAAAHGANCLVVACPMCHTNLDMKQADIDRRYGVHHDMMVYYLSDLIGMALGLDETQLGVDKHFVVKPLESPATQTAEMQ